MIGTRFKITYAGDVEPPEVLEITHYAIGRFSRWCHQNNIRGIKLDGTDDTADSILAIQVMTWAEKTKGMNPPPDFDRWISKVADWDPVEAVEVDPTQPAT